MNEASNPKNERLVEAIADMFAKVDGDYIARTFRHNGEIECYPLENCLIIICENGSFSLGSIGSTVSEWWEFYEGHVSRFEYPNSKTLAAVGRENAPAIKLYLEDDNFVLGERYGPNSLCRRVGSVSNLRKGSSFEDFTLTWASEPTPKSGM